MKPFVISSVKIVKKSCAFFISINRIVCYFLKINNDVVCTNFCKILSHYDV